MEVWEYEDGGQTIEFEPRMVHQFISPGMIAIHRWLRVTPAATVLKEWEIANGFREQSNSND